MISILLTILSITPGCDQSTPGAILTATHDNDVVHLTVDNATPNEFGLFIWNPPLGEPVPFYNNKLCCSWGNVQHTHTALTNEFGHAEYNGPLNSNFPVLSVQYMYRTPAFGYGGNLSNGLIITYL